MITEDNLKPDSLPVKTNLSQSQIRGSKDGSFLSASQKPRRVIHIFGKDKDSATAEHTLRKVNSKVECICYQKNLPKKLKAENADISIHINKKSPLNKKEANSLYRQLNSKGNNIKILKPLHDGESFCAWLNKQLSQGKSNSEMNKEFSEILENPTMLIPKPKNHISKLIDKDEKDIEWVIPGLIPKGELSNVSGMGGVGKSTMLLSMVSAITNGGIFNGKKLEQGNVLLLSFEDSAEKVLRRRLRSMGADLSKVLVADNLDSLDELCKEEVMDEYMKLYKPIATVIDPVVAFKAESTDINKANEVRKNYKVLNKIAQDHNVAMITVSHFNKGTHGRAANKVSGSVDMINGVRSAMQVYIDPDNENKRILVQCKSNFTKKMSHGLSFEITDNNVNWLGESPYSADDLSIMESQFERQDKKISCMLYVLNALKDGPIKAKEFTTKAIEDGHSERMLDNVRPLLTRSERTNVKGEGRGKGYSTIYLKDDFLPSDLRSRTGGLNE